MRLGQLILELSALLVDASGVFVGDLSEHAQRGVYRAPPRGREGQLELCCEMIGEGPGVTDQHVLAVRVLPNELPLAVVHTRVRGDDVVEYLGLLEPPHARTSNSITAAMRDRMKSSQMYGSW